MRPIFDLAGVFADQLRNAEQDMSNSANEALIGLVTDNKDPKKLGRVKVMIPILSEAETTEWCPIVMLGAGKNRGWFFIPEVGDEVLVVFEHGDIERPIVVGALWNGKDKPSDENPGGNPRRVIKSRAGSRVIFDDENDQIIIEDGTGHGRITFDAGSNTMNIEAMKGDVAMQSPAGDSVISATDAELKAGENIEIHAGSAIEFGAGSEVKVTGGASLVISGSKANQNCGVAKDPPGTSPAPAAITDPYGA